jgi:hypothetical protein
MKYKYDLLSGNVHRVEYQPGSQDALYHKYLYDLDNRLTRVFTSRDDSHWEQDAKYYYYLHGPLMRTELGELKVQGLDYAYTMHGWLKSVNGPSLEKNKDMGRDGDYTLTSNLHTDVAKDAFAFGLDYYEGDFNSVNNSQILPQTTGGDIHPYLKDLFNGNIRSMLTSLPDVNQYKTRNIQSHTLGFVYRYDQLNRIKEMRTFDNLNYASNQWDGSSAPLDGTARYFTEYNYDAMGNITHLKRIANQTYLPPGVAPIGTMDDLSYSYTYDVNNHLVHNRLGRVQDAVSTPYSEDLETQSAGNYTYDETGNLITDAAEQIQSIAWNVYGKIKGITRSGGNKPELEYGYGPSGQRVNKTVIPQSVGNREQEKKWSRTWYVRDASGNTMATYTQAVHENKHAITHAIINTVATFTLAEQHLYGSVRLGYTELNRLMDSAVLNTPGYNSNQSFDNYTWQAVTINTLATPYDYAWGGTWNLLNGKGITRGNKRYELSNHLGNVLVTVSDRHLAVDINNNTVGEYFQPFVQSIQDYFPFGSSLPGREWKVNGYRYAINTQEKEPELGDGMSSAEFWMFDGKLGRRWNVDPKDQVHTSNYAVNGNNPLYYLDKNGDEKNSRHYDPNGNFIVEYNDGDNSSYRHQTARTQKEVDYWRAKFNNTSGNGIFVKSYSFLDPFYTDRDYLKPLSEQKNAAGFGFNGAGLKSTNNSKSTSTPNLSQALNSDINDIPMATEVTNLISATTNLSNNNKRSIWDEGVLQEKLAPDAGGLSLSTNFGPFGGAVSSVETGCSSPINASGTYTVGGSIFKSPISFTIDMYYRTADANPNIATSTYLLGTSYVRAFGIFTYSYVLDDKGKTVLEGYQFGPSAVGFGVTQTIPLKNK